MTQTWKKARSGLLCLILILLMALSAVPAQAAVIQEPLDLSSVYKDASGDGWSWNALEHTLRINNLDIQTAEPVAITLPARSHIQIVDGSKNTVISTYEGDAEITAAIRCLGALSIYGNGTLTATGGTATGEDSNSYGIFGEIGLNISRSAKVYATGGQAQNDSYGLSAGSSALGITGHARVEAYGGKAHDDSHGVDGDASILITDSARLLAVGGAAADESSAMDCDGEITISGQATVELQGGAADNNSNGIKGGEKMTVSDSAQLKAIGGAAPLSFGINAEAGHVFIQDDAVVTVGGGPAIADNTALTAVISEGMHVGNFTAKGGSVTAGGDTARISGAQSASADSCGICVQHAFNASDVVITASGGQALSKTTVGGDMSKAASNGVISGSFSAKDCSVQALAGPAEADGAAQAFAYSIGLVADNAVSIDISDISAQGGISAVNASSQTASYSFGAMAAVFNAQGSALELKSGDASYFSAALLAEIRVVLDDCRVSARSGAALASKAIQCWNEDSEGVSIMGGSALAVSGDPIRPDLPGNSTAAISASRLLISGPALIEAQGGAGSFSSGVNCGELHCSGGLLNASAEKYAIQVNEAANISGCIITGQATAVGGFGFYWYDIMPVLNGMSIMQGPGYSQPGYLSGRGIIDANNAPAAQIRLVPAAEKTVLIKLETGHERQTLNAADFVAMSALGQVTIIDIEPLYTEDAATLFDAEPKLNKDEIFYTPADDIPAEEFAVSASYRVSLTSDLTTPKTKFTVDLVFRAAFEDWQNPYVDLGGNEWFFEYVSDLTVAKVIDGYPDKTFRPRGTVTYAEALKLVMKAAGYEDQPGTVLHWAGGYLAKAQADGLIGQVADLNAPIDRRSVADLIYKTLGLDKPEDDYIYSDMTGAMVDRDAVNALYDAGIMEGYLDAAGQRNFFPRNNLSRAELSAIIWRINDYQN